MLIELVAKAYYDHPAGELDVLDAVVLIPAGGAEYDRVQPIDDPNRWIGDAVEYDLVFVRDIYTQCNVGRGVIHFRYGDFLTTG